MIAKIDMNKNENIELQNSLIEQINSYLKFHFDFYNIIMKKIDIDDVSYYINKMKLSKRIDMYYVSPNSLYTDHSGYKLIYSNAGNIYNTGSYNKMIDIKYGSSIIFIDYENNKETQYTYLLLNLLIGILYLKDNSNEIINSIFLGINELLGNTYISNTSIYKNIKIKNSKIIMENYSRLILFGRMNIKDVIINEGVLKKYNCDSYDENGYRCYQIKGDYDIYDEKSLKNAISISNISLF